MSMTMKDCHITKGLKPQMSTLTCLAKKELRSRHAMGQSGYFNKKTSPQDCEQRERGERINTTANTEL